VCAQDFLCALCLLCVSKNQLGQPAAIEISATTVVNVAMMAFGGRSQLQNDVAFWQRR